MNKKRGNVWEKGGWGGDPEGHIYKESRGKRSRRVVK